MNVADHINVINESQSDSVLYDDGQHFFAVDTQYWSTSPDNDRKISQLLMMRALVLFPKFLQYLLQHLNMSAITIPQCEQSTATFNS